MRIRGCAQTLVSVLFFWAILVTAQTALPADANILSYPAIHEAAPVTAETTAVTAFAVSADGRQLAYAAGEPGRVEIWIKALDRPVPVFPRQVTHGAIEVPAMAFAPDQRLLAYAAGAQDIKGDIFLLPLDADPASPIRLTGDDTQDGAPCFGPDGRLYFHQIDADGRARLMQVAPTPQAQSHAVTPLGVSGSYPAVSPNGRWMAYSRQGDLFVLDLTTSEEQAMTTGPAQDGHPTWSPAGDRLYFTRMTAQPNAGLFQDTPDSISIYRIDPFDKAGRAYRLTPFDLGAGHPQVIGDRLYFLAQTEAHANCLTLPPDGPIPVLADVQAQWRLAQTLGAYPISRPDEAMLAFWRVVDHAAAPPALAARAMMQIADLNRQGGNIQGAIDICQQVRQDFASSSPQADLAQIMETELTARQQMAAAGASQQRQRLWTQADDALQGLARHPDAQVAARAELARVNLLMDAPQPPAVWMQAIERMDALLQRGGLPDDLAAEALLDKADLYARLTSGQAVDALYLDVLKRYPDARHWVLVAVERLLDRLTDPALSPDVDAQSAVLLQLAQTYRKDLPALAVGALNRLGDLYYQQDELERAMQTYRQVLDQFAPSAQTLAARLALAEIYYRQQRYRQALSLYESELGGQELNPRLYRLARRGYVQKSLAAGNHLLQMKEVAAARNVFRQLIDFDHQLVAAHRGYIQCAAAGGDIDAVRADYRRQADQMPQNPVPLYADALCLTYDNTQASLMQSFQMLQQVIALDGYMAYAHQTLGYVHEMLETVYDQPGHLEAALASYRQAYLLSREDDDPANRVHLTLNVGNAYFLLGRYGRAFEFYSQRLKHGQPFQNADAAILFYQRLGACAFQLNDLAQTQAAFQDALARIDAQLQASAADDRRRYLELKAAMLDRLALAYQSAENWPAAADAFAAVYALNQELGNDRNLARNLRGKAYNTFQSANRQTGAQQRRLLVEAAADFRHIPELIDRYGVIQALPGKKQDALAQIERQISLDAGSASQAVYGFSAEQEKRLAWGFVAQIESALGNPAAARAIWGAQLADDPPDRPVAEKRRFGVALLNHRVGWLDVATGMDDTALAHFERAANLNLQMGNPVSAGINVRNMGHLLVRLDPARPRWRDQVQAWQRLDRQVLQAWALHDIAMRAAYHNQMGAYDAALAERMADSLDDAVMAMRLRMRAADHFLAGLNVLAQDTGRPTRDLAMLAAAMQLNLARLALQTGSRQAAMPYFSQALALAQTAGAMHIQWRALAGLGRLEDARATLADLTVLQAGSAPGEIIDLLLPLVTAQVDAGQPEAAFNQLAYLTELERFHRLAFLVQQLPETEKAHYQRQLTRLQRLDALRFEMRSAQGEHTHELNRQLEQEMALLGPDADRSDLVLAAGDTWAQLAIMTLIGWAQAAENAAEAMMSADDPTPWRQQYQDAVDAYHDLLADILANRDETHPAGVAALFGPDTREAMDVMALLEPEQFYVQIVRPAADARGWLVFQLSQDQLQARYARDLANVVSGPGYLAGAGSEGLGPAAANMTRGHGATHLVRTALRQNPFKRRVAGPIALDLPANRFESLNIDMQARHPGVGINTLVLRGPFGHPRATAHYPQVTWSAADSISLWRLLDGADQLSLALVVGAGADQRFEIEQMLTLAGCASVVWAPAADRPWLERFFSIYADASVRASVDALSPVVQLSGIDGPSPEAAARLAQERFNADIQRAGALFQQARYDQAARFFENAAWTAALDPRWQAQLPQIYRLAAESHYLAGQTPAAIIWAQKRLRLLARDQPDSQAHVDALLRLGLLQASVGQYDPGIALLTEAADILANLELPVEQSDALAQLGVVLENAQHYDRALDVLQSAVMLSQAADKQRLLAGQLRHIARLYDLRLSRFAEALRYYEQARMIFVNIQLMPAAAQCELDMGRCKRLLGDFSGADDDYQRALEWAGNADNEAILRAKIQIEQAHNAWFQARYEQAFNLQRTALQTARARQSPLLEIVCRNTEGLIWWTLNQPEMALQAFDMALAIAADLPNRSDEVASTWNNIGLVHRDSGRYAEAMAAFETALQIDQTLQSRWAMAYDWRNIGMTALRMGNIESAIDWLTRSIALAHDIGNRINEAKGQLALGRALADAGQIDSARQAFQAALSLAEPRVLREVQWRAIFGLAQLELHDRPEQAAAQLQRAIDIIEQMRAEIRIDQLRDSFVLDKMAVYETLVQLRVSQGRDLDAFDVAERSRARNFIDLLGRGRLQLARKDDQLLYDRQVRLRGRIEVQERLLAQAAGDAERRVYQQNLDRLQHDFQVLLLDIQASNPQLSHFVTVDPLRAQDVAALVAPDVAVLVYYALPDQLLCWVVKSSGIDLVKMPLTRADLSERVQGYRRAIENLAPWELPSRALHADLIAPVAQRLTDVNTLGIVPHGPLHYLSFATLADADSWLIDRWPLFYLPSVSVWPTTQKRRELADSALPVLAVGNPDLGNAAWDLPFSAHEVQSIKWNFPQTTIMTRADATEDQVVAQIDRFGIVHLASHGQFDAANPLRSAIKLARGPQQDGNLNVADVFGLDMHADLVFLSACQTALGQIRAGDELIGLNRAFFFAGTHAVISSLWRISDVTSAQLIKQFYRQYRFMTKSQSLRRAMLHVKTYHPHPAYWGAFVLVGDYR